MREIFRARVKWICVNRIRVKWGPPVQGYLSSSYCKYSIAFWPLLYWMEILQQSSLMIVHFWIGTLETNEVYWLDSRCVDFYVVWYQGIYHKKYDSSVSYSDVRWNDIGDVLLLVLYSRKKLIVSCSRRSPTNLKSS